MRSPAAFHEVVSMQEVRGVAFAPGGRPGTDRLLERVLPASRRFVLPRTRVPRRRPFRLIGQPHSRNTHMLQPCVPRVPPGQLLA
jgi:hypothetical protein